MFSIIALSLTILFINLDNSFTDNRMIRMVFGSYDLSQSMREDQLKKSINSLSEAWLLGDFMGDVEESFGEKGNYIHNYLSFWRQFGFIPFLLMTIIAFSSFVKILIYWWKTNNVKGLPIIFILYISIYII